jgi:iron complex outermembrane receptor protein
LAALWSAAPLGAQQTTGTVRGRVTDATTQQPLAGATISVGTRSALSQGDGRYLITGVPAGTDSLRARLIGYARAAQAVTVAEHDTLVADLALTSQAVNLSAVVVTGYGTQRAGDITGSVTAVTDSQFNTGRILSPQMLIQSKVPGVQVVDNNDPGGGLSLRIRGPTSVTASSDPLYVVDGVPLGTGAGGGLSAGRDPLNFLSPGDIETITVLRDASAAAIYGTNAANGVVLITTKSGKGSQGPRVEYSSSASASSVTRLPDMLNAAQFAAAVATYAPTRVGSLLGANTNWFNLIDRTAYGQEHNFSLTNGTGDGGYRLSFGYLKQDGVIRASSTQRVSLGFNYHQRLLNDHLSLHTSVRGARAVDQFTPGDVLGNAAAMAPTQPVLDPTSPTGYWDWRTSNASASNPVASLNLATDHGTTWRSVGDAQAEYRMPFLEGLSATLNLGYDLARADRTTFYPSNLAAQVRQGQGSLFMSKNSQTNSVLETYLGFRPPRTAGPGTVDLVGGYSYAQARSEYPYLRETGLNSNLLGGNGIVTAANVRNVDSIAEYKLISFFGRVNYNISDRYLIAMSLRHDGSSRFGPGNQWGTFPSVALAWRVSQEPFMRLGSLSDLKVRASWARTGNQAFGDYLQYTTYTFSDVATQVWFGDHFVTTIRPSPVDTTIRWERTSAYNVGLDFGFNNQRYSGSIDWYTKNTSDLIFNVPVDPAANLGNFVTTNIGSMRNRGFELSLNARLWEGRAAGLSWTASFTASHNTNELLSINPNKSVTRILTGGISGGVGNLIQVLQPGVPVNSFYVFQQRYGPNGKPIYSDTLINMYVDQNGDGKITDSDRRPFHDPAPKWILGHSSYLTYGRFDASFTLRAYLGNWVYNNVASANGAYQNLTGSGMPSNLHASVLTTGFVVPQYDSDYFVQNASFLRMDNITLGYSLTYRGQPLRVFATVQNAFTITGYSGVDPTATAYSNTGFPPGFGIDNNIYPRARTITTGLSFRF